MKKSLLYYFDFGKLGKETEFFYNGITGGDKAHLSHITPLFCQSKTRFLVYKIRKVTILLLLLFVALLIIGVFLGEVEIVIQKATMICLSCIGIG